MANNLRGKNLSTAAGVMEDVKVLLNSMMTTDWRQALIARGYGWHFDVGAFSTPIVGGGNGTVFDQDQPEFVIDVPTGITLIPVRFHVATQTPLLATDADETEILLAADRLAITSSSATNGTVETPTNMRSNIAGGCPCTVVSAVTTNTTNPTLGIELGHAVKTADSQTAAGVMWTDLALVYEPANPPFFVGPAAVLGYWGGTVATTGFANIDFIAIPSSWVNALV